MKQSTSILFLVRLYHPHIGGVEKHVETIAKLLINKGFSITILTEQYDKNLKRDEFINGVRIIRIPISKNNFLKKFWIWKWVLLNMTFFSEYKVVHVHDVFYWLYPIFPLIFFKKTYVTFHGYEGFPIRKSWIIQRKITEWLSSGSICVGDFMKKWYFSAPTSVIYGGVRLTNKIKPVKTNKAVFFGRLDEQTGILEYIKAYRVLKSRYRDFKLTIVGEGKYSSKIPKGIKVVKFQKNIDKYIASNRFIFVSRYLSMLEALVQKKEVIAVWDNPVKRDYLEMSPFKKFVQISRNSEEIASFVVESIEKGPNTLKLEDGYAWAKKQSWEHIVRVYLDLWKIGIKK